MSLLACTSVLSLVVLNLLTRAIFKALDASEHAPELTDNYYMRYAAHLDIQAGLLALAGDDVGQVVDAELLGELVEHAHLPVVGRVVDGQLDAAHLRTCAWSCGSSCPKLQGN